MSLEMFLHSPGLNVSQGWRDAALSLGGGRVGLWRAALVGFVLSSEILQPCKAEGRVAKEREINAVGHAKG